ARPHAHVEIVLRGQLPGVYLLEPCRGRVEILDLEAEMMDAAEIGAVRADVCIPLGLEIEDREVDVAVGQKYLAAGVSTDLAQAEGRLVEGGVLCRILCRQRDMLDAGHDSSLLRVYCAASAMTRRPPSSTESPVLRAASMTLGCQSTLPGSGPPTIAISVASGSSPKFLKPR